MNRKRPINWKGVGAACALVALAATSGCELLVSFDRSLIPEDGGAVATDGGEDGPSLDSTVTDSSPPESGPANDGPGPEASEAAVVIAEGGADADAGGSITSTDASEAGGPPETGADAPVDSPQEATVDTGVDTGPDAPVDTGVDAPVDTGVDAPVDTGVDAPAESGDDGGDDGSDGSGDDGG